MSDRELWDVEDEDDWWHNVVRFVESEENNSSSEQHEDIINSQISSVLAEKFRIQGKPDQIKAIRELVFGGKDVILVAKTGFGKSIVFQAPPLMFSEPKIAIIIMPLLALQRDQELKLARIPGCIPFVLRGDTNTRSNRESIRKANYTHGMWNVWPLAREPRQC